MAVSLIETNSQGVAFPDPETAETEPNGLLAVGGDLSVERLLSAYSQGIFPWYNHDQPILWWSPDPRMVLYPHQLRVNRSLRKTIRKGLFDISINQDFDSVIQSCAEERPDGGGTWLSSEMIASYQQLHRQGWAHSVEIWQDQRLAGGLYGVAMGEIFFGESMFSRVSNASKIAMVALVERLKKQGLHLIDCQVYTEHLAGLGAREIPRQGFQQALKQYTGRPDRVIIQQAPVLSSADLDAAK